jgi:ElaB/YqjD/DUF883 family membrane-anchored ribosome-binding protein
MDNHEEMETLMKDKETLKADIERLRNDLGEMLGSIGSYSKERVMSTQHRLRSAFEDIEGKAKSRVRDTTQKIKEGSRHAVDKGRKVIDRRPLTAITVAFASGAAMGHLCKKRRHE